MRLAGLSFRWFRLSAFGVVVHCGFAVQGVGACDHTAYCCPSDAFTVLYASH